MGKLPEIMDVAIDKHTKRGQEIGRGSLHFFEEATKVIPQLEVDNNYRERYGEILKIYDKDKYVKNLFPFNNTQY